MAEQDGRKLVVIGFDDAMQAQEFLLVAMRLVKAGELALHDAVFIGRDRDGRSRVRETTDISPGRGALGGAMWGVLLGTLLGGPIGALVGGAASAGGGALLAKLIDTGIKDEQVKQLRETVRPGTMALALLVSHVTLGRLQTELDRFPGATVVQSDLPEGALHAVRSAMDDVPAVVPDDPSIRIGLDDPPPERPRPEPGVRIGLDDEPDASRTGRAGGPHGSSDPGGPGTPL